MAASDTIRRILVDAYSGAGAYDAAKSAKLRAMLAARRRFASVPLTEESLKYGNIPEHIAGRYQRGEILGAYSPAELAAYYPPPAHPQSIATRRHEIMHGIHDSATRHPDMSAAIPWWARGKEIASPQGELLARIASGDINQVIGFPTQKYAELFPQHAAGYRALGVPISAARAAVADLGSQPVAQGALIGLTAPAAAVAGGMYGGAWGRAIGGAVAPYDPGLESTGEDYRFAPPEPPPPPKPKKPSYVVSPDGWTVMESE